MKKIFQEKKGKITGIIKRTNEKKKSNKRVRIQVAENTSKNERKNETNEKGEESKR